MFSINSDFSQDVSPYEAIELSADIYNRESSLLPMGWRRLKFTDGDNLFQQDNSLGLSARVYKHRDKKCAVIAFRGTVPDAIANWVSDAEIFRVLIAPGTHSELLSSLIKSAYQAIKTVLQDKDVSCCTHIVLTGHSLGAFISETLCMMLRQSDNYNNVTAMTFDGPGTPDNIAALVPASTPINIEADLDYLVKFLSRPNLINNCHPQKGLIYPINIPFILPDLSVDEEQAEKKQQATHHSISLTHSSKAGATSLYLSESHPLLKCSVFLGAQTSKQISDVTALLIQKDLEAHSLNNMRLAFNPDTHLPWKPLIKTLEWNSLRFELVKQYAEIAMMGTLKGLMSKYNLSFIAIMLKNPTKIKAFTQLCSQPSKLKAPINNLSYQRNSTSRNIHLLIQNITWLICAGIIFLLYTSQNLEKKNIASIVLSLAVVFLKNWYQKMPIETISSKEVMKTFEQARFALFCECKLSQPNEPTHKQQVIKAATTLDKYTTGTPTLFFNISNTRVKKIILGNHANFLLLALASQALFVKSPVNDVCNILTILLSCMSLFTLYSNQPHQEMLQAFDTLHSYTQQTLANNDSSVAQLLQPYRS